MKSNLTKQLLLSNNYWVLNKDMVKLLGLEAAFLLSTFAEAEELLSDNEGWFYQTSNTVEKMTTLSRHKQDQCIKQLEEKGILVRDVRGIPAKRYFKINYECLTNQFVSFQQTSMRNINKQDCQKSATSKEHIYKEPNNKELEVVGDASTTATIKDIAIAFEQNGFGTISSYVREELTSLLKEYPADWILDAIKEAVDSNVRNLKYTRAILKRWKAEGKNTNKPKPKKEEENYGW